MLGLDSQHSKYHLQLLEWELLYVVYMYIFILFVSIASSTVTVYWSEGTLIG